MKRLAIAIAAACTAIAPAAFAQYDQYRSYDSRDNSYSTYNNYENREYRGERARVLETRPVYESAANQREECWNPRAGHYEEVRKEPHGAQIGKGTVIGGIAGGILGHQLGSGNGNTAATIGGAALGGYLGNRIDRRDNADNQTDLDRSNCRVIADSGSTQPAYDVRYRWNGREHVTRMDHDPGRFVELGRDVNADGTPFNAIAESDSYSSSSVR